MENRYARYAEQPLQEERPFDFHTSNIQRAQTKRLARYIVRLGNPIRRPPEGRFDDGNETTKHKTERQAFQARKRYFVLRRLFFAYFFLTSQKKYAAGGIPHRLVQKNEPPEASRAIPAQKES